MATLPENRKKLRHSAKLLALRAEELSRIAKDLLAIEQDIIRRRAVRRAPDKRQRVTAKINRDVTAMARDNPEMLFDEIGARFGIDGGRVSEILAGKRPRDGEKDEAPHRARQMDFEL